MTGADAVLEVRNLTKSFGGATVVHDVTLAVGRNQIVGIVGENGAGKSTLFNMISGIVAQDSGTIVLNGREIRPRNYREAMLLGISRVFQEQALVPNIPVYENILLSQEDRFDSWAGLVDRPRMIKAANRNVAAIGLDIDVRRPTNEYDFSIRQAIEVARACLVPQEVLGIAFPIVLLDEPTSALQKTEEEAFFRLIRRVREHGSLLFVSHRLTEVLAVSDQICVLKDGHLVATVDPKRTNESMLHGLMVGRARDADYYHEGEQRQPDEAQVLFSVKNLSRGNEYDDVSLDLHAGEVLGIGGLLESGKSHFGKGAAGVLPPDCGTVALAGAAPSAPDIRRLVREGLGYVPAERQVEGMIAPFSVAWNASLASGSDLFSDALGIWRNRDEVASARHWIGELQIRAEGPRAACSSLSGGNQQKVVLAKWLCRNPKVLILDNPTRGVDAGAKEEIYRLIRKMTERGVGIMLITDELLELIGLSHRIAVMRDGKLDTILDAPPHAKPTERALIALMLGLSEASDAPSAAAAPETRSLSVD
ncbi:MAG TPA: sugar ABC transporter ATP-binding protein [Dongiaceae bacterium]